MLVLEEQVLKTSSSILSHVDDSGEGIYRGEIFFRLWPQNVDYFFEQYTTIEAICVFLCKITTLSNEKKWLSKQ